MFIFISYKSILGAPKSNHEKLKQNESMKNSRQGQRLSENYNLSFYPVGIFATSSVPESKKANKKSWT